MRLTPKQAKAIRHLAKHPDANPGQIAKAVGGSTYGSNPEEFVGRLIINGSVRLVPTDEALEAAKED